MSKSTRSSTLRIKALANALAQDILNLSDEEILAEITTEEASASASAQAQAIRSSALNILTNARRNNLLAARSGYESSSSRHQTPANRPPTTEIRRRIENLFAARSDLSLAFRNGARQSDADWESLWDDLNEMGLLDDSDDKN
ncbi:MAG: hypothetical protein HY940_02170 [Gammaproteobacteria bacterium]|nr:hypothetical protein [Gammaproteobacteria bacterium]